MRMLNVSDLHDGMITGLDICSNNQVVIPKGTVLTEAIINQLASCLNSSSTIWIYDLVELKPLLLKDSALTQRYINFLVGSFKQIFTMSLTDESAYYKLIRIMKNYLYSNRGLLFETIILRDNHCYTYEHSLNVVLYALVIGLREELSTKELMDLALGCAMHDLGKRNISNNILDKPNKLSDSEFKAIKQHPLYGIEFADSINVADSRVKKIILQHHEKLDGTGYPFNLDYSKIDHLARIAAVADIFDAVTSQRAYHKKRSAVEGLDILQDDANKGKISKEEVQKLREGLVLFPVNTLVVLNNGVNGFVVENCRTSRPVVMASNGTVFDLSARRDLKVAGVL